MSASGSKARITLQKESDWRRGQIVRGIDPDNRLCPGTSYASLTDWWDAVRTLGTLSREDRRLVKQTAALWHFPDTCICHTEQTSRTTLSNLSAQPALAFA